MRRAEIEAAYAWLESDIAYVRHFHPLLTQELPASIDESRSLLLQLRDRLNSQNN